METGKGRVGKILSLKKVLCLLK